MATVACPQQVLLVLPVMLYSLVHLPPPTAAWVWGPWSNLSACSVTCGPGYITRTRVAVPEPGDITEGVKASTFTENHICQQGQCPEDGKWSMWGIWGSCTKACGGGKRTRWRECSPMPMWGGKDCVGEKYEEEECNTVPCPPLPINFDPASCTEADFMCGSGKMCIPDKEQCDDVIQCHDGSDEMACRGVRGDGIGSVRYSYVRNRNGGSGLASSAVLAACIFTVVLVVT